MPLQFAVSTRNGRLDAIETDLGTTPHLKLRTGAAPATCATADSGTVLCDMTLPSDFLGDAASGVKSKAGTWSGTASGGGGTIAHFRIYTSGGVCKVQGTCGIGTGDLQLDNTVVADGQTITVTSFAITDGNA